MKKQFIAKLLVLAMLLAMVPASALAASAGTNAGSNQGSGGGTTPPDTNALTLTVSGGRTESVEAGRTLRLSAGVRVTAGGTDYSDYYNYTYEWEEGRSSVGTNSDTYSFWENYTGTYTVRCTVTARPKSTAAAIVGSRVLTDYTTWTINVYQGADFSVDGYVNNDTERYYLGEIQDKYGESIIDQIDAWLTKNDRTYSSYDDATFKVTSSTDGKGHLYPTTKYDLDDAATSVYFYLTSALTSSELSYSGKSTFVFIADVTPSYRNATTYSVSISITVDDNATTSSGDISYTAAIGDDVYFDVDDFEDFYYDKTKGGTLKYVSFDSVSGGTLYSSDGKLGSKDCYVNPTNRQVALDGVYFATTTKQAKTVKIGFTAYGSKSSRSGTVTITYLNGEAKDITYSLNANGSVALKPADFTAAYKEVTNKTAPSGMTIVFQNVPTNGSLTYLDSSKKNAKEVTLKSSGIRSYSFTTRTSGSNQLGDVTYTGSSSRSDTINYIAYSGSTALFTGKVVFNGKNVPTNLAVSFTCLSSAGVNFTASAFNTPGANADVMKSASYIRFGMPAHGTLTYGGSSAVATNIYVSGLSSVLYRPTAGFNGTDTVVFVVYDASGTNIGSGQVNITVSGNTSAATNNGGVTSVDQFTDVPSNAWYRTQLADLVSKGIISGKGDGKFDPTGKLKNGEALKMVLIAAGYPAQAQVSSGSDWAINYKNLAVSNNLISSSVVLNDYISRNAVAELAAKALGLSPVTSGESPFVDSSNGYAIALYNAGIIQGDLSSGSRKFLGSDTLQRAEICMIVYAMNEYVANRYASVKPDGI